MSTKDQPSHLLAKARQQLAAATQDVQAALKTAADPTRQRAFATSSIEAMQKSLTTLQTTLDKLHQRATQQDVDLPADPTPQDEATSQPPAGGQPPDAE